MFCGFLNDLSLFLPLQVSDPPKKKEKFLPQLHSAPDGLFRCCPRQSCTRFRSQLSADYYWKAYHICQTQDTANLPLPELSMAGTWASARKSFVTGWFAGFISVCWWSLNIFQMCWPHKPATYHRLWKNFSKTVFFPPLNYCEPLGSWLGSTLRFEVRLGASLEPGKDSGG